MTSRHSATAAPATSSHRPDIQGLRAIAVIVVVLFHGGWALPGGFIGVDMFFAISGFVITAMLLREWDRTGSIDLKRFYVRRFRRLTPALAFLVAVVMVATSLLLDPFGPQEAAAKTALGVMALCANWVLASVSGNYFGVRAELNPLLHTWSLSVEEQFYLIFPAVLLLGWIVGARAGRARLGGIVVVGAVSLASVAMIRGASIGIPVGHWVLGYYSPFNRVWEFGTGATLALIAPWVSRAPRLWALPTTVASLGLLGAGLVLIDATTPFPGKWTVLPIAATVLLMAGGLMGPNPVSRALAVKPLVLVGDWSYSLYLWHWPCIVVAATLWPGEPVAKQVAAVLSVVPALASYYLVEQPFRLRLLSTRTVVRWLAPMVLGAMLIAATTWWVALAVWQPAFRDGRLPAAYSLNEGDAATSAEGVEPFQPCIWPDIGVKVSGNGYCRQSQPGAQPEVAIIGDSHAEHLFIGLAEALPERNVGVYTYRGAVGYMMGGPATLDTLLTRLAATPELDTVIIARYWTRGVLDPESQARPLEHAVRTLTSAGKHVIVTDDLPSFGNGSFMCRYRLAPVIPVNRCTVPSQPFWSVHEQYSAGLANIVAVSPKAHLAETAKLFCDATACFMADDTKTYFADDSHLTLNGTRRVARALVEDQMLGPLLTG